MVLASVGEPYFTIAFNRLVPPSELSYTLQNSPNLTDWNEGSSYSDRGVVLTNSFTADTGALNPTVVQVNAPLADAGEQFLRVRVVRDARLP